jgi:hypothetical protein
VREFIVGWVRRCIEAGLLAGDATDIAHLLVALAQGLSAKVAGWLGTSDASVDRRWVLAHLGRPGGLITAGPWPCGPPWTASRSDHRRAR